MKFLKVNMTNKTVTVEDVPQEYHGLGGRGLTSIMINMDLLTHLKISKSQGGVVSMEGRMLRTDDELRDGASVQVFQAVYGG